MIDLLKAMERTRRLEPERIEPRLSRKTKRVTVTVYIDKVPVEASVSINRLDRAIDRVCSFADGSGPLQMLFDELLHARQKYSQEESSESGLVSYSSSIGHARLLKKTERRDRDSCS